MDEDRRAQIRRAVAENIKRRNVAASDNAALSSVVIREFTMDDYDAVRQLWEEQGIRLGPGDSREGIAGRLECCSSELFLVAECKGTLLGTIVGSWDGQDAWISHQAVDPTSRNMGIGSRLLGEVEHRLRNKGAKRVSLLVSRDNLVAQDFYQFSGFETEEDQIVMSKRL